MKRFLMASALLFPLFCRADSSPEVSSLGLDTAATEARVYGPGESVEGNRVAPGSSCRSFFAMAVTCEGKVSPLWYSVNPDQGSCILRCAKQSATESIPEGGASRGTGGPAAGSGASSAR